MSDKNNKKFNIFNFFMTRDGKGVSKGEELNVLKNPNIPNFFKLIRVHFNRMLSVNMFYVFGNFPILFALFALAGYTSDKIMSPASGLYTALRGTMYFDMTPVRASINGIFGIQAETYAPSTLTYVFYAIALLVFFTFGIVNVGCTYIIRNTVRSEPVFVWSDFWYAVKRNLRQGIIFGMLDLFVSVMLFYDLFWFRANMGRSTVMSLLYFISFAMIFMYFFMRMYIYLMMITFDLSLYKLIKNSVFFAILGIKRNIMCLIGTVLILGVNFLLFMAFMPVGIILPFIITPSICSFVSVYCAYPKIKEIMIDPYYKETTSES